MGTVELLTGWKCPTFRYSPIPWLFIIKVNWPTTPLPCTTHQAKWFLRCNSGIESLSGVCAQNEKYSACLQIVRCDRHIYYKNWFYISSRNQNTCSSYTTEKRPHVEHNILYVTNVHFLFYMEAWERDCQDVLYCRVESPWIGNCSPLGPRWMLTEVWINWLLPLLLNCGPPVTIFSFDIPWTLEVFDPSEDSGTCRKVILVFVWEVYRIVCMDFVWTNRITNWPFFWTAMVQTFIFCWRMVKRNALLRQKR